MVGYIYLNLLRNSIVRLPDFWNGDSQDQETSLAFSADKQARSCDTESSSIYIYIYIYIDIDIYIKTMWSPNPYHINKIQPFFPTVSLDF